MSLGLQDEASAVAEVNGAERIPLLSRRFFSEKFFPWLTKGGLALLDFGLYSGANFLLGILLARWMAPEQYGAYALVFSIFILVTFLYQALVLEPLSVFSGTTYSKNLRGYLKSNFWLHWGVSVVICVVLGATAVAAKVWWHSPASAMAFAGVTAATPFILIHVLGRRSFYLKLSPGPAAFGSSFYCVLVVAGSFLVYKLGWLSAFSAFLVMGFAALVGGIVMLFQLNAKLEPATAEMHLSETWKKHWGYGKWALGTCIVGWIPTYVYIPLISKFAGLGAAAELRALMNLGGPVLQTYAALSMLFLPYAARVQGESGRHGSTALTRKLTALFVGGAIVYWIVLIPLRRPLFALLYAGKYMDASALLPLFAAETIIWSAALGPAIVLRAMEYPRSLFFANAAASVVAIIFGIPATRYFGLSGVIWSMVVANVLYVAVAFILLGKKLATLKAERGELTVPCPAEEGAF
ncbi:MAG: Membrane protein involved in the export of O-antigen and teichoic acid-like protein [Candidatus Sulfotelmatobacter sp.]|nr:Membrane protein involved in the export of O-antigen and teichoic acid-like protein [Candidatus Sulfotelmatobacter sp.]